MYLQSVVSEMKLAIDRTLLLSSKDSRNAVDTTPPSRVLRYVTLSPLQPGSYPNKIDNRQEDRHPENDTQQVYHTFDNAFIAQGGRVLLLGSPGAGKTTTLLQFAFDAAIFCLRLPHRKDLPIPIFKSIHLWDQETPLKDWVMADVIDEFPGIDFHERSILYIFDGLDELHIPYPSHGEKASGGIVNSNDPRLIFLNAVKNQLPHVKLVISCRIRDYYHLQTKAILTGAVTLLPLEPEQVKEFLRRQGQVGVWELVSNDQGLLKLVRTPLLLALLSLAATDRAEYLKIEDNSLSAANALFDFYFTQRFAHESRKRKLPYSKAYTRRILSELATSMLLSEDTSGIWLKISTLEDIIGSNWLDFIRFACAMNFMRIDNRRLSFIHLRFRDYCAFSELLEIIKYNDDANRNTELAVIALGNIGDPSALPLITRSFEDKTNSSYFRTYCLEAIIEIGGSNITPVLFRAITDDEAEICTIAIGALVAMRDNTAVPALLEAACRTPEPEVRQAASEGIVTICNGNTDILLVQYLNKERLHEADRELIIQLLQKISDLTAIKAIVEQWLTGKISITNIDSSGSLSEEGLESALLLLTEVIKDPKSDEERLYYAVSALGKMGNPSIIPHLQFFSEMDHEDKELYDDAQMSIDEIKSRWVSKRKK